MVQAVPVQLPEGLKSVFVGAAPHITISFAARATAKHAGKQLPQKLMMLRHFGSYTHGSALLFAQTADVVNGV